MDPLEWSRGSAGDTMFPVYTNTLLLQMTCFKSFTVGLPAKWTAQENHVNADVLVCYAQLHAFITREQFELRP